MESLTLKRHYFFQNKNDKSTTQCFAPRPLILGYTKKFEDAMISS